MISAALIAVESRRLYAVVIAFGLLGLELSLTFLLLKAPDVAVMTLVLEMTALAVFAKIVSGHKPEPFKDLDILAGLTFAAFAVLFVTVCVKAFSELPQFGSPLMYLADSYCALSMEKTGASNVVAAVAFNFRGLDSIISLLILLLTAIGIFHVTGEKE